VKGIAEIFPDHDTGAVCINFSGGEYTDPDTGETETVEPTAISLSPEDARDMARSITIASYALEGVTFDD
jgi:hypothetical protein